MGLSVVDGSVVGTVGKENGRKEEETFRMDKRQSQGGLEKVRKS